jgi:hypothetical protein
MTWYQVLTICAAILATGFMVGLAVRIHEHEMRSIVESLERIASRLEERNDEFSN